MLRISTLGFRIRIALLALAATLAGCGGGGLQPAVTPHAQARQTAPQTRSKATIAPNGFSSLRVGFTHSLICDNGILIANYAQKYGAQTIFVPVAADDIIELLAGNPTTVKNLSAMSAVAKVYMVSGDASWLLAPKSVPADAASLAKIAAMYPQITGVLYSVDPETSPSWNSSQRKAVIQSYFTLVNTLLSAPGAPSFGQTLFVAHTDFATLLSGGTGSPTMLNQLQSPARVTGVNMIVPGNSASTQLSDLNASGSLGELSKPFWIEASTSKYDKASYYGSTPSALQANLSQVQQAVSAKNSQLLGIEVNGWNDLYNSVQSILAQPPVFNGTLPTGPLVPAAGTTYLGGYINPAGTGSTPAQTAQFESQIGRKLAYNMHFYGFSQKFPGTNEADDIANGRIPLIAWNCGDSDANVAAGKDDALIINHAKALKAFGKPVFLRWFWEMNLDDTNNAPRTQCYDSKTDLASGYFSPTQYIAAWTRIHHLFATQGVTNVVWQWCVANAHGGPSQYYPGDSQVDWVAMDDYDTNDVSMHDTFFIQANELSQFQAKPFMITETGAHAQTQASFLSGAAAELQSQFPQARAIGYLDSQGSFQNWVLTSTGLADFKTFANDPYMSAMAASP